MAEPISPTPKSPTRDLPSVIARLPSCSLKKGTSDKVQDQMSADEICRRGGSGEVSITLPCA